MEPDGPREPPVAGGEPAGDPPLDLGRLAGAVRRHARVVAAAVAIAIAIALAVSLRAPDRYRATARIAADAPAGAIAAAPTDAAAVATALATGRELAVAPGVLGAVASGMPGETAGSLARDVTASVEPDASILDITAVRPDPAAAARLADTVAETFLAQRATAQREVTARARDALAAQLEAGRKASAAGGGVAAALRERIADLTATAATAGEDLRLAERAAVPTHRSSPHPLRSAVLAGLAALLLAIAAAVIGEGRRARRATRADEPAAAGGLPLLAVLGDRGPASATLVRRLPPAVRRLPGLSGLLRLRVRHAARARQRAVGQAAALQASVRAALPPRAPWVLLVCGADASDRATRVAKVLAAALRWARQDVLLLEPAMVYDAAAGLEAARRAGHRHLLLPLRGAAESRELPALAPQVTAAIVVGRCGRTYADDPAGAARVLRALRVHVLGLVLTAPPRAAAARQAWEFDPPAPAAAGREPDKPAANGRGNTPRIPAP